MKEQRKDVDVLAETKPLETIPNGPDFEETRQLRALTVQEVEQIPERRAVDSRQHDPCADTVELPQDELAVRREEKRIGRLTWSQIRRLLVAAELRKKAAKTERDE